MSKEVKAALEERRIWVGNLDGRLTEFQLLKIVQKCGPIEKFDMLFHKGGPLVGQSRGYAFVTFATVEGSLTALEKLNGSYIANRPIVVRLAKNVNYDEMEKPKIRIAALGTGKREETFSKAVAIRAIEAKLKNLERCADDELELNTTSGTSSGAQVPFIARYQYNKDRETGGAPGHSTHHHHRHHGNSRRPYNTNQRPHRR